MAFGKVAAVAALLAAAVASDAHASMPRPYHPLGRWLQAPESTQLFFTTDQGQVVRASPTKYQVVSQRRRAAQRRCRALAFARRAEAAGRPPTLLQGHGWKFYVVLDTMWPI